MAAWHKWIGFWTGIGFLLLAAAAVAGPPATGQSDAKQFDDQFRPLLRRHCATCHSGDKPKGKLRLDILELNLTDTPTRKRWAAVVDRLKDGEMPPKEKPRPPEKEIQALTNWLLPRVNAADAAARAAQGRVV